MNDIKLSSRLTAVLDTAIKFSPDKSRIIDVGSDHGHLAAVALTEHGFKSALLTDIHEDPARKSRSLMKDLGLEERSEVICTDGLDSAALDDVFELLAWNQGIGYFSSEIGPSTLFQAYKTIKNMEKQGKERGEICELLKEKFGEKNPDVKVQ